MVPTTKLAAHMLAILATAVLLGASWHHQTVAVAAAGDVTQSDLPDFSFVTLRKVDVRELARKRAGSPIVDLATGAIHMRESLFVDANYVKCPAYAHLFRLIKRQVANGHHQPDASDVGAGQEKRGVIRQNTVEALAIVVTSDRIFYHELLVDGARSAAEHFLEATKLLETNNNKGSKEARDAWLDLIGCLADYMSAAPGAASTQVEEFLNEPARAKAVASLKQFKSIPLVLADVTSEKTPKGLVSGLVRKMQRTMSGLNVRNFQDGGQEDLKLRANALIESLDDEETREARLKRGQFSADAASPARNVNDVNDAAAAAAAAAEQTSNVPATPVQSVASAGAEAEGGAPINELPSGRPSEIELVVPFADAERPRQMPSASICNGRNARFCIDILRFIRVRMENNPIAKGALRYEKPPKLSMRLAFDFNTHWQDLSVAELNDITKLGREAASFRRDAQNIAVAKRIQTTIDQYMSIIRVLSEMKLNEDKYESMDDLRLPFERLTELLTKIDPLFDLDDIRRIHAIWRAKYVEYSTMDRFINSSSW